MITALPGQAPLPPLAFVHRVRGEQADHAQYLAGGFEAAAGLLDALDLSGVRVPEEAAVLDFACGCARVTRWLRRERPRWRLHGMDADLEMLAWCRLSFPDAVFTPCRLLPPTRLAAESFDLILAVSIFNHFDEKAQDAWLDELRRLLRPGGAAVVTFHGPELSEGLLRGPAREAFLAKGFHYMEERSEGWGNTGEVYQSAYHSRSYVERAWTRGLRLRAYASFGCDHWQDVVVLEKTAGRARAVAEAALPMAWVQPSPSAEGRLRGWAFFPDGRPFHIEALVDGRAAGSCRADRPRAEVLSPQERKWGGELLAGLLSRWPRAELSGFELALDPATLRPGTRRLDLRVVSDGRAAPVRLSSALLEVRP